MRNKGLGRGLDALMPEMPSRETERVTMLEIGDIDPNPNQPRRRFHQASLQELADSIRQVGVLQPILVCQQEGRYRIIAGERRWRAARMAELDRIPVIIRDMGAVERMEAALVENLQREDLNPMDEAAAVRALMEECGLTQEAAAERLGRSRPALANLLRLLFLPEQVIALVRDEKLSAGHARVLAGIGDPHRCEALALKSVSEGWSVRQIEQAAQLERETPAKRAKKPQARQTPEFLELEDRLRFTFGMKAQVKGTLEKGKITLQYGSRDELERLYDLIGGQSNA